MPNNSSKLCKLHAMAELHQLSWLLPIFFAPERPSLLKE